MFFWPWMLCLAVLSVCFLIQCLTELLTKGAAPVEGNPARLQHFLAGIQRAQGQHVQQTFTSLGQFLRTQSHLSDLKH